MQKVVSFLILTAPVAFVSVVGVGLSAFGWWISEEARASTQLLVRSVDKKPFYVDLPVGSDWMKDSPYVTVFCFSGGRSVFTSEGWLLTEDLLLSNHTQQLWQLPWELCVFRRDPNPGVMTLEVATVPAETSTTVPEGPSTTLAQPKAPEASHAH